MADIDINPFGDHNKTNSNPDETGENIPFIPGGVIEGSTWEPEQKQETTFGGTSQKMEVLKEHVEAFYLATIQLCLY